MGEAVESALLRRPSPPAEARYVEGNQLAVGGAKGFRGRAEATRCIWSLHRVRVRDHWGGRMALIHTGGMPRQS